MPRVLHSVVLGQTTLSQVTFTKDVWLLKLCQVTKKSNPNDLKTNNVKPSDQLPFQVDLFGKNSQIDSRKDQIHQSQCITANKDSIICHDIASWMISQTCTWVFV